MEYELVVDEPIEGHFYWVISMCEAPGTTPVIVDFAHGPAPTHKTAADAGSVALRWHQRARTRTSAVLSGVRADWYAETVPAELR
jgi:hypothetical protein